MVGVTGEVLAHPAVRRMVAATGVKIRSVQTVPFLGADIYWEQDEDSGEWDISLYPAVHRQGPTELVVAFVIAMLYHLDSPVYVETPADEFDRLNDRYFANSGLRAVDVERAKREIVSIDEAASLVMAMNYTLQERVLSVEELRYVADFFAQRIGSSKTLLTTIGASVLTQELGASSRHQSVIEQAIKANRWYELLVVADKLSDAIADLRFLHRDAVDVYEMLSAAREVRDGILNRSQFVRKLVLGGARRENREYDVALSYADDDQETIRPLSSELRHRGYRVYDAKIEMAMEWGRDLVAHIDYIYRESARYCLILLSENYAAATRTHQELRAAQARAFVENGDYILPLRLDEVDISGILPTTGFVDLRETNIGRVVDLLSEKLSRRG